MKKIAIFTGAGISKESGIPTFRDSDGLWEKYDPNLVSTLSAWNENPGLVLEFFNARVRQYSKCEPNVAHIALAKLEEKYNVTVVTQNVDTLHEKGGSSKVIHIHGNITQSKSSENSNLIYPLTGDIKIGDKCEFGSQLRHNVVLFEENMPEKEFQESIKAMEEADILIVVGTSLAVFPAANLISCFNYLESPLYIINPEECRFPKARKRRFIKEKATIGVPRIVDELMK